MSAETMELVVGACLALAALMYVLWPLVVGVPPLAPPLHESNAHHPHTLDPAAFASTAQLASRCPDCAAEVLPSDATFCADCGYRLDATSPE